MSLSLVKDMPREILEFLFFVCVCLLGLAERQSKAILECRASLMKEVQTTKELTKGLEASEMTKADLSAITETQQFIIDKYELEIARYKSLIKVVNEQAKEEIQASEMRQKEIDDLKGMQQATIDKYDLEIAEYKSLINIFYKHAEEGGTKHKANIKSFKRQLAISRMTKRRVMLNA